MNKNTLCSSSSSSSSISYSSREAAQDLTMSVLPMKHEQIAHLQLLPVQMGQQAQGIQQ